MKYFIIALLCLFTFTLSAQGRTQEERRKAFEQRQKKFELYVLAEVGGNFATFTRKSEQVTETGINAGVSMEVVYNVEPEFGIIAGGGVSYFSIGNKTRTGVATMYTGLTDNQFIAGGINASYLNESKDVGLGAWIRLMYPVSPQTELIASGSGRLNAFNNMDNFPSISIDVGIRHNF